VVRPRGVACWITMAPASAIDARRPSGSQTGIVPDPDP
jgi:hypothetical protein